jgi:hypothetical protein
VQPDTLVVLVVPRLLLLEVEVEVLAVLVELALQEPILGKVVMVVRVLVVQAPLQASHQLSTELVVLVQNGVQALLEVLAVAVAVIRALTVLVVLVVLLVAAVLVLVVAAILAATLLVGFWC